MSDLKFSTYKVAHRWFNVLYSDFDYDQRMFAIVLAKRGFKWEWFIKSTPGPHEHFEYRLFK